MKVQGDVILVGHDGQKLDRLEPSRKYVLAGGAPTRVWLTAKKDNKKGARVKRDAQKKSFPQPCGKLSGRRGVKENWEETRAWMKRGKRGEKFSRAGRNRLRETTRLNSSHVS